MALPMISRIASHPSMIPPLLPQLQVACVRVLAQDRMPAAPPALRSAEAQQLPEGIIG